MPETRSQLWAHSCWVRVLGPVSEHEMEMFKDPHTEDKETWAPASCVVLVVGVSMEAI